MEPRRSLAIPIALVLGALIIGFSIYMVYRDKDTDVVANTTTDENKPISIRPVDATDFILGNPNAKIIIVEYSDLECPFCIQFHETLHRIINEYGKNGEIAWVYRHFPIAQLHTKAPTEALATECAAAQGGNEAFWKYMDAIMRDAKGNDTLDLAKLPEYARQIGLNVAEFDACMKDGTLMANVEADFNDALAAGGDSTPYSIIIANNEKIPVIGAQPYPAMKAVVELILRQTGTLTPPTQ